MAAVTRRVWVDMESRLALTEVQHNASSANSTGGLLSFFFFYLVHNEVMLAIS